MSKRYFYFTIEGSTGDPKKDLELAKEGKKKFSCVTRDIRKKPCNSLKCPLRAICVGTFYGVKS